MAVVLIGIGAYFGVGMLERMAFENDLKEFTGFTSASEIWEDEKFEKVFAMLPDGGEDEGKVEVKVSARTVTVVEPTGEYDKSYVKEALEKAFKSASEVDNERVGQLYAFLLASESLSDSQKKLASFYDLTYHMPALVESGKYETLTPYADMNSIFALGWVKELDNPPPPAFYYKLGILTDPDMRDDYLYKYACELIGKQSIGSFCDSLNAQKGDELAISIVLLNEYKRIIRESPSKENPYIAMLQEHDFDDIDAAISSLQGELLEINALFANEYIPKMLNDPIYQLIEEASSSEDSLSRLEWQVKVRFSQATWLTNRIPEENVADLDLEIERFSYYLKAPELVDYYAPTMYSFPMAAVADLFSPYYEEVSDNRSIQLSENFAYTKEDLQSIRNKLPELLQASGSGYYFQYKNLSDYNLYDLAENYYSWSKNIQSGIDPSKNSLSTAKYFIDLKVSYTESGNLKDSNGINLKAYITNYDLTIISLETGVAVGNKSFSSVLPAKVDSTTDVGKHYCWSYEDNVFIYYFTDDNISSITSWLNSVML